MADDDDDDGDVFGPNAAKKLNDHAVKLDAMKAAVSTATTGGTQISSGRDVLKELADAAAECAATLEYYDDDELPWEPVGQALVKVQRSIADTATSLIAYVAVKK